MTASDNQTAADINRLEPSGKPQWSMDTIGPRETVSTQPTRSVRSREPKPKRRWKWSRVFGIAAICLIICLIGYIGYVGYEISRVSTQPFQLSGLATDANGRVNILVLGVGDPGHAGEYLSDSMMILSIDTRTDRVAQISVPRDLQVDIPGYGVGKINAADAVGGTSLSEQVVSNTLGIPINYYVRTDFSGLNSIVNAMGGLNVDVTQTLDDPDFPCANDQYKACGIDISPGLQHMNGAQVLEYVRCRKGTCGNDFGRDARQQSIMNLIRQQIFQWGFILNPTKLVPVVTAARNGVQTDMNSVQIVEFAALWQLGHNKSPVHFVLSTSPGGYLEDESGSTNLIPVGGNFDAIQNYVENIFTSNNSTTAQ